MRNAKQSGKSNTSHYNKTMELSRKEQQVQLEATLKYERFKKSSSLPTYDLNKARLKKITEIYRTLSSDKINLHTSKSRRNSPSLTPEKRNTYHPSAFTPLNLNSLELHSKQKNKLTLQRGSQNTAQAQHIPQSGNSAWAQLTIKLRNITNRFDQLSKIKSEDIFMAELEKYLESFRNRSDTYNKEFIGGDELSRCLKTINDCLTRRQNVKVAQVRKNFANLSEELSTLQIELKKKQIRAILDQKQIQKYQKSNKDLDLQLAELKKSLTKKGKDMGCGTENSIYPFSKANEINQTQNIFTNTQLLTPQSEEIIYARKVCGCNCSDELEVKTIRLAECMRKLQAYSKRQKQFLSVLVVLRGEGIDIEKIYDDVVNGRIQIDEADQSSMLETVAQLKKSQKKLYHKYRSMKASNSFDADNSIISSADGLSFNYDEKSLEEDVYTIRREYKCKKQLKSEMKEKLKLNFDVLYDEDLYVDDYESDEEEEISNPPTI